MFVRNEISTYPRPPASAAILYRRARVALWGMWITDIPVPTCLLICLGAIAMESNVPSNHVVEIVVAAAFATVALGILRAILVWPLSTRIRRDKLGERGGLTVLPVILVAFLAALYGSTVGGLVGTTDAASARVLSCHLAGRASTRCEGTWAYRDVTYSGDLPGGVATIGSTMKIRVRPGQPDIALEADRGTAVLDTVFLGAIVIGAMTVWGFAWIGRRRKVAFVAHEVLRAT